MAKVINRSGKGVAVPWHDKPVEVVGYPRKLWHTETAFQIYCATWLRKYHTKTRFHHSANERSNGLEGLRAKLMGQSRGWPDFIVFGARIGVYELKVGLGVTSPEQDHWLDFFASLGWQVGVVRSFEQFKQCVEELM